MASIKKIPFILLFYTLVQSKTIRSKLYTTENGTKELSVLNGSAVNQQEIDFLLRNLNELNITTELATQTPPTVEVTVEATTGKNEVLKENIMMQHWNSLTEAGWRNFTEPIKKMYLNSTRILRLAPEFKREDEREERGKDSTDVKTAERKPLVDNEKPSAIMFDLCQSIIDLCRVAQPRLNRKELVGCLTSKNKTLLEMVEEKLEKNEKVDCYEEQNKEDEEEEEEEEDGTEATGEEAKTTATNGAESPRTLLRPRRLLHKVLLPLLVILVIKYLVTVPFVALSVFTLNAMWLGLLSLGAVMFAKFKGHDYFSPKYPSRRISHIPGTEVYDVASPISASDIIWSPVRVPYTQANLAAHTHIKK